MKQVEKFPVTTKNVSRYNIVSQELKQLTNAQGSGMETGDEFGRFFKKNTVDSGVITCLRITCRRDNCFLIMEMLGNVSK